MAIRPLKGNPPISCNSKCHVARGSAPGTDYGVSEGTLVIAPFSGVISAGYNSRAGNYLSIVRKDGVRVYLMHLKERLITFGNVNEGDNVAKSGGALGATYSGSSTGPHLHADIRDNNKQYGMEEWLAQSNPASLDEKIIITIEEETMKSKFFITNDGVAYYVGAPGVKKLIHINRSETLTALRQILATGEATSIPLVAVQEIESIMSQLI